MNAYKATVLLLALAPALAYARKESSKTELPAIFNHAQYVYVQATDGDEFNPDLLPEDRQAIADVEHAIQNWGRYILVDHRSQADLVFVVRRGRLLTGRANAGVINQPFPGVPGGRGTVVGAGGEVGPQDDLFWVCRLRPDGRLGDPLWHRTEKDGLESPGVPLFQEFKRAVDQAYPQSTVSRTKKP